MKALVECLPCRMCSIDGKPRLSTVNYVILDRIGKNADGFQYMTDNDVIKKNATCVFLAFGFMRLKIFFIKV